MGIEQPADVVRPLPAGRILAVDERGIGLRLTWRLDRGFLNLSLWRHDRCVETFHLTPSDASRLVSFIVRGLAETATTAPAAPVSTMRPAGTARVRRRLRDAERRVRVRLARLLRAAATAVQADSR